MVVLSGMLEEGEMLVLGGSWLYYNNIDFLDAEGKGSIKPSIGKGRLCLTNQRLLILSAESVLGTSQKTQHRFRCMHWAKTTANK